MNSPVSVYKHGSVKIIKIMTVHAHMQLLAQADESRALVDARMQHLDEKIAAHQMRFGGEAAQ